MTEALVWRRSDMDEDMEDILYDVSTQARLHGAYLDILSVLVDEGYFTTPRPVEDNFLYRRLTKRKKILETAVGNSSSGALSDLKKELDTINRDIELMKERYNNNMERLQEVQKTLENQDGEEAQRIVNNFGFDQNLRIVDLCVVAAEMNQEKEVAQA